MAYEAGTASNHNDLLDKLRTFLTTAGPTGAGWTELAYEGGNPKRMLFRAPGLSGTEQIHVGFRLYESIGTDTFGFYGWMARSYDAGLDIQSQPGDSGDRFHPTWDSTIPYWFFGNAQRVIIVTKISTTYQASYLGKFLQYGTAGEYGQPYVVLMPWSAEIRFSTISESVRNFWDPGPGLILLPNGAWWECRNWYESNGESSDPDGIHISPYNGNDSSVYQRFRELRDNVDGSYTTFPLVLNGTTPASDVYGELDGAFAVSGFSTAAEDTITVGADTLRVFQNGFRTSRMYYCAIKQA